MSKKTRRKKQREQALQLQSQGCSYRQIAKRLGCSIGTVHNFLTHGNSNKKECSLSKTDERVVAIPEQVKTGGGDVQDQDFFEQVADEEEVPDLKSGSTLLGELLEVTIRSVTQKRICISMAIFPHFDWHTDYSDAVEQVRIALDYDCTHIQFLLVIWNITQEGGRKLVDVVNLSGVVPKGVFVGGEVCINDAVGVAYVMHPNFWTQKGAI